MADIHLTGMYRPAAPLAFRQYAVFLVLAFLVLGAGLFGSEQAAHWIADGLSRISPPTDDALSGLVDSPAGEIYRYRVAGLPGYSVADLETVDDWMLERRFKTVPGVIGVTDTDGKSAVGRRRQRYGSSGLRNLQQENGIVRGIVLPRRGAESAPAIERIDAELQRINASGVLPPGVRVERFGGGAGATDAIAGVALEGMIAGAALLLLLWWAFSSSLKRRAASFAVQAARNQCFVPLRNEEVSASRDEVAASLGEA